MNWCETLERRPHKTCRHCDKAFKRPDEAPIPHDRCARCHEEITALGWDGTSEEEEAFQAMEARMQDTSKSDGSTAKYYELPIGALELQDLISYRDMNAQDGEIFRAIYRKGLASHSDELRDAKKVLFYAQAEVQRLERYGR